MQCILSDYWTPRQRDRVADEAEGAAGSRDNRGERSGFLQFRLEDSLIN